MKTSNLNRLNKNEFNCFLLYQRYLTARLRYNDFEQKTNVWSICPFYFFHVKTIVYHASI